MKPMTWHLADELPTGGSATLTPNSSIGLWVLLGVITVLFALMTAAYLMRMAFGDWRPLATIPWQLWLSTSMLIGSSAALQGARVFARRGERRHVQIALIVAGVGAFAFLAAQLWAWQQMVNLHYLVAGNPANSFFYLLTGLHGLHVVGGLVAWSWSCSRLARGAALGSVRLSIELCARYWHFLLGLWLVLFGLMFFVTPEFIQIICNSY